MRVRPVVMEGSTNKWELVACHETLGEFAIDDNEALPDPSLSRFILEVRDVTIPPSERRFLPNRGVEADDNEGMSRAVGIRWRDRQAADLIVVGTAMHLSRCVLNATNEVAHYFGCRLPSSTNSCPRLTA